MHRIFSATFEQYMYIKLQYIRVIPIFLHLYTLDFLPLQCRCHNLRKMLRMITHLTPSFFSDIILFSEITDMVSLSADICYFTREIPANSLEQGLRYISF